jgi:hypothetical protein
MPANRFFGGVNANGSATLLGIVTAAKGSGARIVDKTGTPIGNAIMSADVQEIDLAVYDMSSEPEQTTYTAILAIGQVLFDTIQQGGLWWIDPATGYNFETTVPPQAFPTRDQNYRCIVQFKAADGINAGIGEWILAA